MNRLLLFGLLAITALSLLFASCGSDKGSTEACLYETTMNLDKGNYDAVIASPCASGMHLGAAYFGKSGFDIKDVINRLSDAGSLSSGSTGTSSVSDLSNYMTDLVGDVTEDSLTQLGRAKENYCTAAGDVYSAGTCTAGPQRTQYYADAKFYISLVDTVNSLSVIRVVLPNILDANGNLNTACDSNSNGVPDDADATACALIAAANISTAATVTCSGANYVRSTPIDLTLSSSTTGTVVTGTYSGLTISMIGGGTTSGCTVTPPNPDNITYKRLLYRDTTSGLYWVATTTSSICRDANNNQWPCPIIQNNQPLDMVTAIDTSLTSALDSLSSSLTGTASTDVQTAINDIKTQACPNPAGCTSEDIAKYLTDNLK